MYTNYPSIYINDPKNSFVKFIDYMVQRQAWLDGM